MPAVIEKETPIIMHEIVLHFVVSVRNIHDRRRTVNVLYNTVAITTHFCITHYKFIEPVVSSVA